MGGDVLASGGVGNDGDGNGGNKECNDADDDGGGSVVMMVGGDYGVYTI